ncbi:MAG: hypothetical protein Q7T56_19570 [Nocardioidaceae bacterium]|nr:hypothetical protein [Nocardioidaceae bacterium]
MDDQLRARLDVYRQMPDVPDGVVDLVADELDRLAGDHDVTDDSAGMLTSHLVTALARMASGAPDVEAPDAGVVARAVADVPGADERAAAVSARAAEHLGTALTPTEQQYLTLHLATLAITSSKEKS